MNLVKQMLSHYPFGWLNAIALLIFLALFITMFLRAYARGNRETLEEISKLPLEN